MKKILVCGAGGFIGTHLVERLRAEGNYVVGVDLKRPSFSQTAAHEFHIMDLREIAHVRRLANHNIDQVYQLAADMGGAGYIFTGQHDAEIMHNSAQINLNMCHALRDHKHIRVLYTSSACMYPAYNQQDPENPVCVESSAYPAEPDSEYGWEKLFSERLYLAHARNFGTQVRIARLHNVFGPLGAYADGREKAPAAICRKVSLAAPGTDVAIWGSGTQTRSFLYIEECVEGLIRLMNSDCVVPVNLGSEQRITIRELARRIIEISGKPLGTVQQSGPEGVRGRTSENTLIRQQLGWAPAERLDEGLAQTYAWVDSQIQRLRNPQY